MSRLVITPSLEETWDNHAQEWQGCHKCPLARSGRHGVVLARGYLPADILFIGEAPGESEDVMGAPFVGPAGRLLNDIIEMAADRRLFRTAFGNIVGCLPNQSGSHTVINIRPPEKQEAMACRPRLEELIHMADPQLVVTLGAIAKRYLPKLPMSARLVNLVHPAAILRMSDQKASLTFKQSVVTLTRYMEEVVE